MPQLQIALSLKEQIEKRACEFYVARGCEPGMDAQDWLAAENELALENEFAEAFRETQKASPALERSVNGGVYDGSRK